MMPAWVYVLGYVALLLVIVATAAIWARLDSRAIAAGREGQTWRRVRTDAALYSAIVVDLARVYAGHARHVTVATVREMWGEPTGQHRAGWGPSTLQQIAPRRVVGVDFGPVPTVVPRPAPPIIGEVALAVRFPVDTQEFSLTFGTVEIGATL